MKVLLEGKDIEIAYGAKKKRYIAVSQMNFQIYQGETFGLVGESGSGKTTIGRAVMRLVPVSEGEIYYRGEKINGHIKKDQERKLKKEIQMIFQDPMASLNERAKVEDIIAEGLCNIQKGISKQEKRKRVEQVLLEVGLLPEFASRFPHEFSGGQRQRIGIARALIMEPEFIIADEPISALDVSIRAQVLNLLSDMQKKRGITYLFIAHDLAVMRYISDRIGVIYRGRMVELAESEELMKHPLHPYTKSLLSAIPLPDPVYERTKKILVYNPKQHDYTFDKPLFLEVIKGHFVLANHKEYKEYQKQRIRPGGKDGIRCV